MLPRASTTISFPPCSAWTTSDPSGSWRRSLSPVTSRLAVGQPFDRVPHRMTVGIPRGHNLGFAVHADGHHLPFDPVAEPQPPLMPPRRLGDPEPTQQNLRLEHGRLLISQRRPRRG